MCRDQLEQRREFRTPESHIGRQGHGTQPELGVSLRLFHMDVRRLLPFVAEEEPEASNTEDSRHSGNLPAAGGRRQPGPFWMG